MCDRAYDWLKEAVLQKGPIPPWSPCAPRMLHEGTLYEGLGVKKCFGVSAITISSLPTFQEGGLARALLCIEGMAAPSLGGAERSSPEARRGRAARGART